MNQTSHQLICNAFLLPSSPANSVPGPRLQPPAPTIAGWLSVEPAVPDAELPAASRSPTHRTRGAR
jgi:hypothetical protein